MNFTKKIDKSMNKQSSGVNLVFKATPLGARLFRGVFQTKDFDTALKVFTTSVSDPITVNRAK